MLKKSGAILLGIPRDDFEKILRDISANVARAKS